MCCYDTAQALQNVKRRTRGQKLVPYFKILSPTGRSDVQRYPYEPGVHKVNVEVYDYMAPRGIHCHRSTKQVTFRSWSGECRSWSGEYQYACGAVKVWVNPKDIIAADDDEIVTKKIIIRKRDWEASGFGQKRFGRNRVLKKHIRDGKLIRG